jgi:hypothetical protein
MAANVLFSTSPFLENELISISLAPQSVYSCTLQYLESMASSCDDAHEEAYAACMDNP